MTADDAPFDVNQELYCVVSRLDALRGLAYTLAHGVREDNDFAYALHSLAHSLEAQIDAIDAIEMKLR